jgi:pimeloyl-ACP methyl ester carboxylesterase
LSVLTRRRLLSLASVPAAIAIPPAAFTEPKPIATDTFVPIGGIKQWVAIRGHDRSRTAILFLHDGPCDAQSPHLSASAPWEERYVVAQWGQRGAGKTFEENGSSTPDVTFEQIAQDAVEVAEYVVKQLGMRKLILVGHSWGAILGLRVIRLRPGLFHALVNTGQPVIGRDIVEDMRLSAIDRARAAGNIDAAAELNRLSAERIHRHRRGSFRVFNQSNRLLNALDSDMRTLRIR